MINRLAANIVLLIHFAIVLFAVFGALGVLASARWPWYHLPVVIWSSAVNLAGWTCPLTPLENRFRVAAAGQGYEGGFVQHYVGSLVYPGGMPRRFELIAGVAIVVWNALLYGVLYGWLAHRAVAG